MKICEVLHKDAVIADLKARNKKGILEELVAPVAEIAGVQQEDLVKVLLEREHLGSTGIGGGIVAFVACQDRAYAGSVWGYSDSTEAL